VKTITSGRVALVLSGLALLIALGGTAYAVNTVRSGDIVDGTIQSRDIGTNAVQSVDIKQNTIASADIAPGAVGTSDIAASSLGRVPAVMVTVAPNGMTLRQRGQINSTGQGVTTGLYIVQFDRTVTGCFLAATAVTPGQTATANISSSGISVEVNIANGAGTAVAGGFDLVVFC
jgi:hypothetical protein